jgi:hypothetical protein
MKGMMKNRGIEVDEISTKFKNKIRLENGKMLD